MARAHRHHDPRRLGWRVSCHATRLSVTTGRCLRSASNVTVSSIRAPGWPMMSVCGLARCGPRPRVDTCEPRQGDDVEQGGLGVAVPVTG
jgi:hypothetical protein